MKIKTLGKSSCSLAALLVAMTASGMAVAGPGESCIGTTTTITGAVTEGCILEVGESLIIEEGGSLSAVGQPNILVSTNDGARQIDNYGRIEGPVHGIIIDRAVFDGDINNWETGVISTGLRAVDIQDSTLNGNLNNAGLIESGISAIHLEESILTGSINNSGTLRVYEDEDPSLFIGHSQVKGDIVNSGTISGPIGIMMNGISVVEGDIINSGTIDGEEVGVGIAPESELRGRLINSGTIKGMAALYFIGGMPGLDLETAPIDIVGTDARLVGLVAAPGSDFTLKSGAHFTLENHHSVASVLVEEGATFVLSEVADNPILDDPLSSVYLGMKNGDDVTTKNGFTNAGTVYIPAGQVVTLNSDYVQTGVLRIGADSKTNYGRLVVLKSANLGQTMKIDVDVTTGNSLSVGEGLADILVADGGITGANSFAVTDNSTLFNFAAVKDGNSIDLTVQKGLTAEEAANNQDNTPGANAARLLDNLIADFMATGTTGSPEMDQVLNTFGSMTTEKEVSDAIRQVLPLLTGGQSQATGGAIRKTGRIIQARQEGQLGHSSGDSPISSEHAWVKPFGSWTDQSDRNGVSGFSANSYGLALGADAAINDRSRMGVAFSYANSNVDGNSTVARQKSDVDSYQLAVYGSYSLTDATQINLQADAGLHDNEGSRQIAFMGQAAKADYNSWSGHVGGGLTHRLDVAEGTTFTPGIRADYTHIYDQSYRESGAGALNLHVDSNHTQELLLTAEGKVVHRLTDRVSLTANAGVSYDLINDQASITSAFAGAPSASFTTEGLDPSPWIGHGGLGVEAKLTDTMTLSVNYDIELREDFNNQSASAKLRWAF
ncbi:autotransporter family protein [Sneathiella chinensis]|uniref:Autotransporter domain-containing protein n=1 Tax=Sneathiella chinensis TaxID=349750 RepID=A0ABQ5U4Y9_9PROT|nr:autotransporter outer membrane beta-barrel domain-containing protein [Sneathiella chinensis]GLQ07232.1 hypothetical protein GCM10007924_24530 [Sneathiella chinensis]